MTTLARYQTDELARAAHARSISLSYDDANTLRRAALTLQRWAEGECGSSGKFADWAIQRDDDGKPWRYIYPHRGPNVRYSIPDRERGALRRVAAICERLGLHYYHQGDPRGCSLYIDAEPIPDNNYTRAIACRR
jgi:hypothetical protein